VQANAVRPRSSSKRSRAAEVHNLSEKVPTLIFLPFVLFIYFLILRYMWDLIYVGYFLNRGGGVGSMRK
jgi:hypothetical protein